MIKRVDKAPDHNWDDFYFQVVFDKPLGSLEDEWFSIDELDLING